MYENYSRQALPSKEYRALLGSAICVFNSNNSFIIENILSNDNNNYNWYDLIDRTSGELSLPIKKTITKISGTEIASLFNEVVEKRNRIVHSFQCTHNGEQLLATKKKSGEQFIITEEVLLDFIKMNQSLSTMLHDFRGY